MENKVVVKGLVKNFGNLEVLKGMDASDIYAIDQAMIQADGTKDKSNLGANAILAVSIACVRAAAASFGMSLINF